VVVGILLGMVFIRGCHERLQGVEDVQFAQLRGGGARKTLLMLAIMTAHAFGEGAGMGVAFAGRSGWRDGVAVTAAIGVHNVPEGLAIAAVLVTAGSSALHAAAWAVFTHLPQAVVAVPAFLFVETFQALLPMALGFAAGCMLWMVFAELLPDASKALPPDQVATAATLSAALLELFRSAIARGGGGGGGGVRAVEAAVEAAVVAAAARTRAALPRDAALLAHAARAAAAAPPLAAALPRLAAASLGASLAGAALASALSPQLAPSALASLALSGGVGLACASALVTLALGGAGAGAALLAAAAGAAALGAARRSLQAEESLPLRALDSAPALADGASAQQRRSASLLAFAFALHAAAAGCAPGAGGAGGGAGRGAAEAALRGALAAAAARGVGRGGARDAAALGAALGAAQAAVALLALYGPGPTRRACAALGPAANVAAAAALGRACAGEWAVWCGGKQRALLLAAGGGGSKRATAALALVGFAAAFTVAVGAFAASL